MSSVISVFVKINIARTKEEKKDLISAIYPCSIIISMIILSFLLYLREKYCRTEKLKSFS